MNNPVEIAVKVEYNTWDCESLNKEGKRWRLSFSEEAVEIILREMVRKYGAAVVKYMVDIIVKEKEEGYHASFSTMDKLENW